MKITKILYIIIISLLLYNNSYSDAKDLFHPEKVNPIFEVGSNDLITTIDNLLWYFVWLLYFVSIIFWLYWWFMVLTSWWDEEKVKKWKNIVIYMILWLIIIFLVSQLVNFIITLMSDTNIVWK